MNKAEPMPLARCIEEQRYDSTEEKARTLAEVAPYVTKPESLLDQTQVHLHAALVALKRAHQTAKAAKLPHDQIDAAIKRAEITWAVLDPFHGLDGQS